MYSKKCIIRKYKKNFSYLFFTDVLFIYSLLHLDFLQLQLMGFVQLQLMGFVQLQPWGLLSLLRASHVAKHRPKAHGLQESWCMASVVVMLRFSCSVACGIFLEKGLNLHPPSCQVGSRPLDQQASPREIYCKKLAYVITEADMSPGRQPASLRTRRTNGTVSVQRPTRPKPRKR